MDHVSQPIGLTTLVLKMRLICLLVNFCGSLVAFPLYIFFKFYMNVSNGNWFGMVYCGQTQMFINNETNILLLSESLFPLGKNNLYHIYLHVI